jgi:hypothetical protein
LGIIELFPAREGLGSDIPARDGKNDKLFLQCTIYNEAFHEVKNTYMKEHCNNTSVRTAKASQQTEEK